MALAELEAHGDVVLQRGNCAGFIFYFLWPSTGQQILGFSEHKNDCIIELNLKISGRLSEPSGPAICFCHFQYQYSWAYLRTWHPMEFFDDAGSSLKPSLFELVAQEQLRDLLQPALKYVLAVSSLQLIKFTWLNERPQGFRSKIPSLSIKNSQPTWRVLCCYYACRREFLPPETQ